MDVGRPSTKRRRNDTIAEFGACSHHVGNAMKHGFIPIRLEDYVERYLRANSGGDRADLIERLEYAIASFRNDERCRCGAPIWIIGSAEAGLACFTCITGEATPDNDYEIDVSDPTHDAS